MKTISIYQVEDIPIGSGGMGRVLRGTDQQGRPVAIKEILPEFASDFEIRTRTEREVELLQQLNSDSIVKVYDQFPLDGNFYIVMELVDGLNVEQYVRKYGAIPYERATRFMVKILEAMQMVHEKNFVHRDMKPSNIMIREDERICILDFGIAKDLGHQDGVTGTVIGTIIGSDGYMSPEQADGFSIDHRADIYALGCVFYYMLTGHHAYDTLSSDFETRSNIANTPFPKLSKHSKKAFPNKLQEILDHATDRNMMKRYQSCREFRKDLENLIPSASSNHTVISSNKAEDIFITIGREGCDIIIDDPLMKVSRNHLEISYKQFTGGRYYVITDHSSNGTLVNGKKISRNESETIPADADAPLLFLAADMNYPIDWEEVKRLIAGKIKQSSSKSSEDPVGGTQYNCSVLPNGLIGQTSDCDSEEPTDISFVDAIRLFFTRAFDFKGRSRRKEYWYVMLLNMIINVIVILCQIASGGYGQPISSPIAQILIVIAGIYGVIALIPGISLSIRRLHDIGKDWKVFLLWLTALIPFVGIIAVIVVSIVWIVWMATDSEPVENDWGPCPK